MAVRLGTKVQHASAREATDSRETRATGRVTEDRIDLGAGYLDAVLRISRHGDGRNHQPAAIKSGCCRAHNRCTQVTVTKSPALAVVSPPYRSYMPPAVSTFHPRHPRILRANDTGASAGSDMTVQRLTCVASWAGWTIVRR